MKSSSVSTGGDCACGGSSDTRYPIMDKGRGVHAAVGLRIYAARMAKGLKQNKLSEMLGLSDPRALWRYEYGHQLPGTKAFGVIAAGLDTSMEWLLKGGDGGPVPDPAPNGMLNEAIVAQQEAQTRKRTSPRVERSDRRAEIAESAKDQSHWLFDMFESRGIDEDDERYEQIIDELARTAGRYDLTTSIARTVFKLFQGPSASDRKPPNDDDPDPSDGPERAAKAKAKELTSSGGRTMLTTKKRRGK